MKHLFIFIINIYQQVFSMLFKNILGAQVMCRFSPSCSEYAKQVILKYGVFRGSYLSLLRILSCQPLTKRTVNYV